MRFAIGTGILTALAAAATAAPQQPADGEAEALMRRLGKLVRSVEEAIDRADAVDVAAQARMLEIELAPRIALAVPQATPEARSDVPWHVDEVRRQARALAAAAAAEGTHGGGASAAPAARQPDALLQREALWRLRQACAACHLQLRADDGTGSFWPGGGNAVFGRISLRAEDGSPRERADHVVVFVDRLPAEPAPPGLEVAIVQRDRTFTPDLLVVAVGTTVEFPNRDSVFHNIFSLSKPQPFDLKLYGPGESRAQLLAQPGLVKIYCNIHPEMAAHVLVLNNPHGVRVTPSGFYCLTELPDGAFDLRTWSEFGGGLESPVQLGGATALRLDLTMQEQQRRLPHRNKYGRPYREKY